MPKLPNGERITVKRPFPEALSPEPSPEDLAFMGVMLGTVALNIKSFQFHVAREIEARGIDVTKYVAALTYAGLTSHEPCWKRDYVRSADHMEMLIDFAGSRGYELSISPGRNAVRTYWLDANTDYAKTYTALAAGQCQLERLSDLVEGQRLPLNTSQRIRFPASDISTLFVGDQDTDRYLSFIDVGTILNGVGTPEFCVTPKHGSRSI